MKAQQYTIRALVYRYSEQHGAIYQDLNARLMGRDLDSWEYKKEIRANRKTDEILNNAQADNYAVCLQIALQGAYQETTKAENKFVYRGIRGTSIEDFLKKSSSFSENLSNLKPTQRRSKRKEYSSKGSALRATKNGLQRTLAKARSSSKSVMRQVTK